MYAHILLHIHEAFLTFNIYFLFFFCSTKSCRKMASVSSGNGEFLCHRSAFVSPLVNTLHSATRRHGILCRNFLHFLHSFVCKALFVVVVISVPLFCIVRLRSALQANVLSAALGQLQNQKQQIENKNK